MNATTAFDTMRRGFRRWRDRAHELRDLPGIEVSRVAAEAGVGISTLHALAALPPDSADLLPRRLASLGLSEDDVIACAPGVLRDMERLCSFCRSKRRCAHDLSATTARWPTYCPNAATFADLIASGAGAH